MDQRISWWARQLKKAGLTGSMDELRARAYLDLLLDKDSRPTAPAPAPAPPPAERRHERRRHERRRHERRRQGRRRARRVRTPGPAGHDGPPDRPRPPR